MPALTTIDLPTELPALPIDFIHAGVRDGTGTLYVNGSVVAFEAFKRQPGAVAGQFDHEYVRKKIYKDPLKAAEWTDQKVILDANGRAVAYGDGDYMLCLYLSTNPPPTPNDPLDPDPGNPDDTITPVHYGHEVVNVLDFGAVPDANANQKNVNGLWTDNLGAFQAAIDYCLSDPKTTPRRLFVPAGAYWFSDTLTIASKLEPLKPAKYDYVALQMYGEKRSVAFQPDSILLCEFKEAPLLAIQAGQAVTIRDLAFVGANRWGSKFTNVVYPDFTNKMSALLDDHLFIDDSDPQSLPRDDPHSPHAAIAIDPYSPARPGMNLAPEHKYPNKYHLYVDSATSTSYSSAITIEGCAFHSFIVGIVVSPAGINSNAENISIRDCTFKFNRVAIAIGQDQARSVQIENVSCYGCQVFVDTRSYGNGSGEPPHIRGANVGGTRSLFYISTSGQSVWVEQLYCESSLSLGYIGAGVTSAETAAHFLGCTILLSRSRPSIDTHLWSFAPVHFVGCTLAVVSPASEDGIANHKEQPPLSFFNSAPVSFTNSALATRDLVEDSGQLLGNIAIGFHDPDNVTFDGMKIYDQTMTEQTAFLRQAHKNVKSITRLRVPPGATIGSRWPDLLLDVPRLRLVASGMKEANMATVTLTILSKGKGIFTPPFPGILRVGDLICCTNGWKGVPPPPSAPGPWVPGVSYFNKGACGMVTNVDPFTGVTVDFLPQNMPTGAVALKIKWFGRYHPATAGRFDIGSNIFEPHRETTGKFVETGGPDLGAVLHSRRNLPDQYDYGKRPYPNHDPEHPRARHRHRPRV